MKDYQKRLQEIKRKLESSEQIKVSHCQLWERQYPDKFRGIPKAIAELRKQEYLIHQENNFGVTDYLIYQK